MLGGYYFYLSKKEKELKEKLIELLKILQTYNFCVNTKICLDISRQKKRLTEEEFDERNEQFNKVCTDQESLKEEIRLFFNDENKYSFNIKEKKLDFNDLIYYDDSSDLYLFHDDKNIISNYKFFFTSEEWKEIEKNFNISNFKCMFDKAQEREREAEEEAAREAAEKEEREREIERERISAKNKEREKVRIMITNYLKLMNQSNFCNYSIKPEDNNEDTIKQRETYCNEDEYNSIQEKLDEINKNLKDEEIIFFKDIDLKKLFGIVEFELDRDKYQDILPPSIIHDYKGKLLQNVKFRFYTLTSKRRIKKEYMNFLLSNNILNQTDWETIISIFDMKNLYDTFMMYLDTLKKNEDKSNDKKITFDDSNFDTVVIERYPKQNDPFYEEEDTHKEKQFQNLKASNSYFYNKNMKNLEPLKSSFFKSNITPKGGKKRKIIKRKTNKKRKTNRRR